MVDLSPGHLAAPRPGRWGWLFASRARLAITALLTLGGFMAAMSRVAPFIREDATSNFAILLALLGCAFVGLVAALLCAGLVGDLVFGRAWRERVLAGMTPSPGAAGSEPAPRGEANEDIGIDALGPPKSHVFGYSALVVAVVVGLFAASEAMTQGVLGEYRAIGAKRVTLRGADHEAKREVMALLGEERRDDRVPPAIELLDVVWRDARQPEETRRQALAALGELVDYLNGAVDSWRREGKAHRWQETLVLDLRRRLQPELRASRRTATGGLRADLTRLLGLLRDRESERELVELATSKAGPSDPSDPDDEWVAAIQALAELRTLSALSAMGDALGRIARLPVPPPPELHALLALATSKLAYAYHFERPDLDESSMREAEREALARVAGAWSEELSRHPPSRGCAAAIALMRLRHGAALAPLMARFDEPSAGGITCEIELVELGLGRKEALGARLVLRRRLLDAIAVLSAGNAEVRDWLGRHLTHTGGLEDDVRLVMDDFHRRLTASAAPR